jgi:hypothetical protein
MGTPPYPPRKVGGTPLKPLPGLGDRVAGGDVSHLGQASEQAERSDQAQPSDQAQKESSETSGSSAPRS